MAETFRARIAHKRDTSANWTKENPVLLNGEIIIVDTDAGEMRYKVGDGNKTYTQLPFTDEVMLNLVDSKIELVVSRVNTLEEWHVDFVEASGDDILSLFESSDDATK